jgi:hypothetical protein
MSLRLTRCPICKTLTLATLTTCACGVDLVWFRAEVKRLQAPSATWQGRAPVVELAAFRPLKPETRRAVAALFRKALP